jgi:hypothetical protein
MNPKESFFERGDRLRDHRGYEDVLKPGEKKAPWET